MVSVTEYKSDEYMIEVTSEEAIRLIQSLANQLSSNNPNHGRIEFTKRRANDVTYFSIAIKTKTKTYQAVANDMVFYKDKDEEKVIKFIKEFNSRDIMPNLYLHLKEIEI